jgi:hypothetical protein
VLPGNSHRVFPPPPHLVLALEADREAPLHARRAVQALMTGVAPLRLIQDVLLMTSELVSNSTALGGGCELSVWYMPNQLATRVEVFDRSELMPVMRNTAPAAEYGGKGLRIVDALASRWGVTPRDHGKAVWFELTA